MRTPCRLVKVVYQPELSSLPCKVACSPGNIIEALSAGNLFEASFQRVDRLLSLAVIPLV